jgi:hypothetical protein
MANRFATADTVPQVDSAARRGLCSSLRIPAPDAIPALRGDTGSRDDMRQERACSRMRFVDIETLASRLALTGIGRKSAIGQVTVQDFDARTI